MDHSPIRRIRWMLGSLAAVIAIAGVTTPAPAQYGQAAGIAKSTTPEYFRRDVLIFVEGLDLDETQRGIVEGLFEDYIEEFDAGFARVQERLENLRPELTGTDQQRVMRLVFSPFLDWFEEHDRLGEQFLANVYAMLNAEQQAEWESFRRRLRREKTLSEGTLAGERIDLVAILRDMRLDEETSERIAGLVEQYEIALDQALIARNDSLKAGRTIMIESIQEDEHTKSVQLMRTQVGHRVRVRDVNFEFVGRIGELLPPEESMDLREKSLERAYPRVFRETPTQRIYAAALESPAIDEDTHEQIASLAETYAQELTALNEQLLIASMQADPQMAIERAESFAARMRGERPTRTDDHTRQMFKQRDEVGLVYMQLLSDLLPEEIFARLPGASRLLNHGDEAAAKRARAQAMPRDARDRAATTRPPAKDVRERGKGGLGRDTDKK